MTINPTIRVADLLSRSSPRVDELPDCLGDSNVLGAIPMLARQRQQLLQLGYRFVPEDQLRESERLATSLQLLQRLQTRVIPYRRTLPAVRELATFNPELCLDPTVLADVIAVNYTFHEGAHAVFYDIAGAQQGALAGRPLVEVLLASEGFAIAFNKMSLLLGLPTADPIMQAFFALNMSIDPYDDSWRNLDLPLQPDDIFTCAKQYPAQCLRFLASASLLAMLRPDTVVVKPGLSEHLAQAAGLPVATWPVAVAMMKQSLQLPQRFRDRITVAFFAYNNLLDEYRAVIAQPLEHMLGEQGALSVCWTAINDAVWGNSSTAMTSASTTC